MPGDLRNFSRLFERQGRAIFRASDFRCDAEHTDWDSKGGATNRDRKQRGDRAHSDCRTFSARN